MHYLIDGHNLIARLPDIDLADPDDEAKLVARLKRWTSAGSKRKVTVIFDAGLPGGHDRALSNSTVTVVFAPTRTTADVLLIKRIDKARDVGAMTVVTSDQAIIAAAQRRRMAVVRSEAFALVLSEDRRPASAAEAAADEPRLSPSEVAEWLELFGPEPETPPASQSAAKPKKKRPTKPTSEQIEAKRQAEEIAEWLRLFGYSE